MQPDTRRVKATLTEFLFAYDVVLQIHYKLADCEHSGQILGTVIKRYLVSEPEECADLFFLLKNT
jgi:hypothetical protein